MSNTLDALTTSRILYGRELLSQLKAMLMMGKTVSRRYSQQGASPFGVVRVPSVTVPAVQKRTKNNPVTLGDSAVTYVDVTLDQHAVVPMQLDSLDAVISDIDFRTQMAQRAAYQIAYAVETDLATMYNQVAQFVGSQSTAIWASNEIAVATGAIALLDQARAPQAPRYGALSSAAKASALGNTYFTTFNNAGPASTLVSGSLGERFGVEWGLAQGVASHVGGGIATNWAGTVLTNGIATVGASTIAIDGFTAAAPAVKKGDAFKIGNYFYVVTADSTGSGNAFAALPISPPIQAAHADGTAVTRGAAIESGVQNLMYLPEAFALATAPMNDARPGTDSSIISDEQTGLSIRVTATFNHLYFQHIFTTELLYGFKCVRPELAVRLISSV